MGDFHVTDGRVSGGQQGAAIIGVIACIAINLMYFMGDFARGLPTWVKIVHIVISLLDIKVAKLGQRIGVAIDGIVHSAAGDDVESFRVSDSLTRVIIGKFLGAITGVAVFEVVIYLIVDSIFGFSAF